MKSVDLQKIKCVMIDFDGTLYSNGDWAGSDEWYFRYLPQTGLYSGSLVEFNEEFDFPEGYHLLQKICVFLKNHGEDINGYKDFQKKNIYNFLRDETTSVSAELLEKFCKKYPVYLLTDSCSAYLEHYLKVFGYKKSWFKKIICNDYSSEDLSKESDMKKVLMLEKIMPNEAIMIGDSLLHDKTPAEKLNINALQVQDKFETEKIMQKMLKI